ncbi:DNA adenine methylase [Nitrosomonas sp. JL21]|uniref:DNA adenine methylase n=1 Tax=Nitrosomonas sp. JL21 TaxID=153949 RepID=UPI0013688A10|nr:DNA adenine methylase [Nitrosomonas sp. JL21]MBL8497965.1 DNA adenine methylase [Nitrosomonas sp.]MXS78306.1 DNA adenine methylase [Nitrosomonas sp. JL21]
MKFNTPLRYSGGRDKLTGFMKMIFEQNDLLGGEYVEPYAGSAAIALNLLTHGYASRIHLNEANPLIYAFWHSVINEPEGLCKSIHDAKITLEEWHRQQAIFNSPGDYSPLELGFSVFFLNRVNRSGIRWESANEHGHEGPWKCDARFDKVDLVRRIEWISLHRSLIRLYQLDVADLIQTVLPTLPSKTLVYLETPWNSLESWLREKQTQPLNMARQDIVHLIKTQIAQLWIASYANTADIRGSYQDYSSLTYHSTHDRCEQTRIMFFSRNLIVPNMHNSSDLKTA